MSKATCMICKENKEICCSSGIRKDDTRIDPVCVDCCFIDHKISIWDGKVVDGGTHRRLQ